MKNRILFNKNIDIDFNSSYLVNYFINNSTDDTYLLSFRMLVKNSINLFLNIKDDNYSFIDLSTNDFRINFFESETLNSSFLSNVISFEKNKDEYKLAFKKGSLLSSFSFKTTTLNVSIGNPVTKDYLKRKKYSLDSLMLG